jgi:pimeloyl-ACP methyl ester carboxylesterase
MSDYSQSSWVIFSHGSESGPVGTKINALALVAESMGYDWESIDYRGIADPTARVHHLIAQQREIWGRPILVGSSLGAHVATAASARLNARSLFLMAPAFYMPGFESLTPLPHSCPITMVHGWQDEVVPVEHSIRYAKEHASTLICVQSDHRLSDQIQCLSDWFRWHLTQSG